MAGVLERIRRPQKRAVIGNSSSAHRVDLRILELQAAKEILAEIFGVRISVVEEMIQNRYEDVGFGAKSYEDTEQWPREFLLME